MKKRQVLGGWPDLTVAFIIYLLWEIFTLFIYMQDVAYYKKKKAIQLCLCVYGTVVKVTFCVE